MSMFTLSQQGVSIRLDYKLRSRAQFRSRFRSRLLDHGQGLQKSLDINVHTTPCVMRSLTNALPIHGSREVIRGLGERRTVLPATSNACTTTVNGRTISAPHLNAKSESVASDLGSGSARRRP